MPNRALLPSRSQLLLVFAVLIASILRAAEEPAERDTRGLRPMLENEMDRPLRYWPNGSDFVITNGSEFFNRPLYGGNTAFRADAGDRPEFSLYASGRHGNLRIGIRSGEQVRWSHQLSGIVARYRPGAMRYELTDELLGNATLQLDVLGTRSAEGLLLRAELLNADRPMELICAFGGVNGERGRREGDIGCESKPVSEFFQLRPEQCRSNLVVLGTNWFTIRGRPGMVAAVFPADAALSTGDARNWNDLTALAGSNAPASDEPVAVSRFTLKPGKPRLFAVQKIAPNRGAMEVLPRATELDALFSHEEELRRRIAERVTVDTPDPFVNAAVPALNIAADAVWDDRQSAFMHGGVAWRVRLLGWRVSYSGDVLGWHDRTQEHFEGYARQQNTNAVPESIPAPESSANLSRNETALHSNGDLTRTHYDMNLVAVDAFFRHVLWTGDLAFAERMWPVIERHLAWERRLFRREFGGTDRLPLYEAYAAIWASDDLAYSGGGSAHGSAYNYYHNRMAARVAGLLGKDPKPYEREAALIARAMRRELWLPDRGWFAEWKDLLGLQAVHPSAAAWTFYHTIDSEVPTPFEAWQMTRSVETQIARIPVRGPNVPSGNFTMPTSSWMPYTWSLNNVVLAESTHSALAFWQADRPELANPLFKGALLDSMYLGLCPGNVGMCTDFDAYRRESQRDFGDGVGSLSRALVEGLFGVRPDVLAGELTLHPGFPDAWDRAAIRHPDFRFAFRREGLRETYSVESHFPKPMKLRLQIPALRETIAAATANGQRAAWHILTNSIGRPQLEIEVGAAPQQTVVVEWSGAPPASAQLPRIVATGSELRANCGAHVIAMDDPQQALTQTRFTGDSVHGVAAGAPGHRTVFAEVEQAGLRWWQALAFEIRPAWELLPAETQDASQLRFRIRNNTPVTKTADAKIQAAGKTTSLLVHVEAFGDSPEIVVPAEGSLPGSNPVAVDLGNGIRVSGAVVNWHLGAPPTTRFESIPLTNVFNDRVGQIFRNEYLAPRSPYCSLALPKQGIGSWCHPLDSFDVDDSGLRAVAAENQGRLTLPQGIPFATPTNRSAPNILFTSQWNNYPRQAFVPLSGKAAHAYLLMAGSSPPMQSRFDNGDVIVTYDDGAGERLPLRNPTTWWPIEQDYFIDDFAFRRPEPIPPRVDLKTGRVRVLDLAEFKGKGRGVPGGAATVLDLPLDSTKTLRSLTVRSLANEVVIGLMGVTLVRPDGPQATSNH